MGSNKQLTGEIQWLETSTIKQRSITRTPPNPIAPQPNITAKATTQRAKSIQQTPSNIRRMLANTANKRIPRVSSKSEHEARFTSGLYFPRREPALPLQRFAQLANELSNIVYYRAATRRPGLVGS
jgi:cell fate regulator YaaT (PSP1 superfamily)